MNLGLRLQFLIESSFVKNLARYPAGYPAQPDIYYPVRYRISKIGRISGTSLEYCTVDLEFLWIMYRKDEITIMIVWFNFLFYYIKYNDDMVTT